MLNALLRHKDELELEESVSPFTLQIRFFSLFIYWP